MDICNSQDVALTPILVKFYIALKSMEPSLAEYNPRDKFPIQRIKLANNLNFGEQNKLLVSKYDADGQYVFVGGEDGIIRVLTATGKNDTLFQLIPEVAKPVTCIALNYHSKDLRHTAMATYADGGLAYWHGTSKQMLSYKKYEKMLNCCGFSRNGVTYSFAGEDFKIHIGNLGKQNSFDLKQGRLGEHSNRVYCTKWHDQDPNLLYSGGWDETLYFWDIRCQEATHKVYNVTLSGEGIDVKNDLLLIGNEGFENQLRVYDLRTHKIQKVEWVDYGKEKSMVSACAYDRAGNILAGSIKTSEVRLFENNKCVDIFNEIDKHLYSVAVSPSKNEFVATYGQGEVAFFTY